MFVYRLKMNRREVSANSYATQMHFSHDPIPIELGELHSQANHINEPTDSAEGNLQ
jgi:hypothetical protein